MLDDFSGVPAPRSLRAVGCGGVHGGVRDRLDRSGDGRRPLRDVYGESAVVGVAADRHDLPSTVPLNSDRPGALVGRGIAYAGSSTYRVTGYWYPY